MRHLAELCLLLVDDIYGELCAHVFKILADWGRNPLQTIVRKAEIPRKSVHHGLTILIQQHLILHHTAPGSVAFYEVDWDGAYNLLRSGKMVALVESRLGSKPAHALASLLQLGHARVSDLEAAFVYDKVRTVPKHGTNGIHVPAPPPLDLSGDPWSSGNDKITSHADLHHALWELLEAGYICKVHSRTYMPAADQQNQLEAEVMEQFKGQKTTGPKGRVKFLNAVTLRKRRLQEEDADVSDSIERSVKRQKINGDLTNGYIKRERDTPGVVVRGDLVLRVNFEKCAIAMRSDKLVKHATRFLGDASGRVYEALLHTIERQVKICKPREELEIEADDGDLTEAEERYATSVRQVLSTLESSAEGFDPKDFALGGPTTNGMHQRGRLGGHANGRDESLHERLDLVNTHLKLLSEHPHEFAIRCGDGGGGEYQVRFNQLRHLLKNAETESVVAYRFGSVAARIVRILKHKGKLDEKQICSYALLKLKDLRTLIDDMHAAGFVETQEVPKDSTRISQRSIYLWYFDQERMEQAILHWTYKAMSRCLQRIKAQRDAAKVFIDKSERLDVVGNEERYLTSAEKERLRAWREEEEKLLCQVFRMDEGVAIVRDF